MNDFLEMLRTVTPDVYASLKLAVEIGKWPDGRKLTLEQKELCMQAMIAWEQENLPEEERTGYMAQTCKSQKTEQKAVPESMFVNASDTLH